MHDSSACGLFLHTIGDVLFVQSVCVCVCVCVFVCVCVCTRAGVWVCEHEFRADITDECTPFAGFALSV